MEPTSPVSIVLTFLFTGGGLLKLIQEYRNWRAGKATEEKEFNQRVIREARANEITADIEAKNRRLVQEYASQLIRLLHERGIDDVPDYPALEKLPDTES